MKQLFGSKLDYVRRSTPDFTKSYNPYDPFQGDAKNSNVAQEYQTCSNKNGIILPADFVPNLGLIVSQEIELEHFLSNKEPKPPAPDHNLLKYQFPIVFEFELKEPTTSGSQLKRLIEEKKSEVTLEKPKEVAKSEKYQGIKYKVKEDKKQPKTIEPGSDGRVPISFKSVTTYNRSIVKLKSQKEREAE